jgi:RHS repeat-associated protein
MIATMKHALLRAGLLALAWLIGTSAFAGEQVTYFHNDVLGSPIAATDQKGYVIWRATYEPYGERIQSTTDAAISIDNTRWYSGHVQDDETGLLYMQARYMDPQLGRFLSIDPAAVEGERPATFNRYSYGANNPYRYIDPDGRDFAEWMDRISNPFSYMVPSEDSFRSGTRQLLGYTRSDDFADTVVVNLNASMFESAAKDTAVVGNYWLSATAMAMGGGGTRAPRAANFVYRGLAGGENILNGLFARARGVGNSPASHVAGKLQSEWISASRSLEIARSRFGQNGVVAIDLNKVTTTVVDLTKGIEGQKLGTRLSNWAIKMQEVLIQDSVPARAITPIP